jgi:hypothetical protein
MSISLEGLMTVGGDETRALAMVKVNHKINKMVMDKETILVMIVMVVRNKMVKVKHKINKMVMDKETILVMIVMVVVINQGKIHQVVIHTDLMVRTQGMKVKPLILGL